MVVIGVVEDVAIRVVDSIRDVVDVLVVDDEIEEEAPSDVEARVDVDASVHQVVAVVVRVDEVSSLSPGPVVVAHQAQKRCSVVTESKPSPLLNCNLPAVVIQQPGGRFCLTCSCAVVSEALKKRAAASHEALSKIGHSSSRGSSQCVPVVSAKGVQPGPEWSSSVGLGSVNGQVVNNKGVGATVV